MYIRSFLGFVVPLLAIVMPVMAQDPNEDVAKLKGVWKGYRNAIVSCNKDSFEQYMLFSRNSHKTLLNEYCAKEESESVDIRSATHPLVAIYERTVDIHFFTEPVGTGSKMMCAILETWEGVSPRYELISFLADKDSNGKWKIVTNARILPGDPNESPSEKGQRTIREDIDSWQAASGEDLETLVETEERKREVLKEALDYAESKGFRVKSKDGYRTTSDVVTEQQQFSSLSNEQYRDLKIERLGEQQAKRVSPRHE
jgi:hypothetical protein